MPSAAQQMSANLHHFVSAFKHSAHTIMQIIIELKYTSYQLKLSFTTKACTIIECLTLYIGKKIAFSKMLQDESWHRNTLLLRTVLLQSTWSRFQTVAHKKCCKVVVEEKVLKLALVNWNVARKYLAQPPGHVQTFKCCCFIGQS